MLKIAIETHQVGLNLSVNSSYTKLLFIRLNNKLCLSYFSTFCLLIDFSRQVAKKSLIQLTMNYNSTREDITQT